MRKCCLYIINVWTYMYQNRGYFPVVLLLPNPTKCKKAGSGNIACLRVSRWHSHEFLWWTMLFSHSCILDRHRIQMRAQNVHTCISTMLHLHMFLSFYVLYLQKTVHYIYNVSCRSYRWVPWGCHAAVEAAAGHSTAPGLGSSVHRGTRDGPRVRYDNGEIVGDNHGGW